jgi:peptidoglycan/LPS O-acetylase OafA/YrhL
MLPAQFRDFSQSVVGVSLFLSNVLFWQESDYFDLAAEEKPLLHTWSLAVEEQYYLLFPVFLILAWGLGRKIVLILIFFMAALSLALTEWGWRNEPSATFYLAPFRAWELLVGSICAFVMTRRSIPKSDWLVAPGLFLIIYSIFSFNAESIPFPSLYALLPVSGAAFIAERVTWHGQQLAHTP